MSTSYFWEPNCQKTPREKNLQCPICLEMVDELIDRTDFPGVPIKSCLGCRAAHKMNSYLVTMMLESYGYRWQDVVALYEGYQILKNGEKYNIHDFMQGCLYKDYEEVEE